MFRKKLKITSIASAATGDLLFTIGLGNDGNVYLWNSMDCRWILHKSVKPEEQTNVR